MTGSIIENPIAFINRLLISKYWNLKLALLLTLYSLLFATPAFYYMREAFNEPGWQVVMKQVNSDFIYQPSDISPNTQAAKKTFRLTVPLIAKVLHLGMIEIYILQFLLGILFIYLIIGFVHTLANDKSIAFLFATGFVSLFVGRACFTDIYSRFEGWCYLFIFLSIYFNRHYLIFLFAFLACWTDERAIIGLSFAFMYWIYRANGFNKLGFADIKRIGNTNYAMIAYAVVAYMSVRIFLQMRYGYYTPLSNVTILTLAKKIEYFNFGMWTFLEGFWLLVIYKIILLVKHKHYSFLFLNLSLILLTILSSFLVFDVTKSGSFIFIDVFTSLIIIAQYVDKRKLVRILAPASLVCVLFPPAYIILDMNPYILQQNSVITLTVKFLTERFIP